jgi:3-O-methylgallate 3,4-dioxygenase
MAEIVLGMGSSHSPMLGSPAEDYQAHADIDQGKTDWKRSLVDVEGNPRSFEELVEMAPPGLAEQLEMEVLQARAARCQDCIGHLAKTLDAAKLDALIVIGDDQHEQFHEDNMPSILVYWGETIENNVLQLSEESPEWWKRARSQYHEAEGIREYPVAHELGRHLIGHLVEHDFDVSHSRKLPRERGEGHAFGFVHRRLMGERIVPILPVAMNTYFPPNQPTPRRCQALGAAIREAVRTWSEDARIGVIASGGLSHFTVNEALDRAVLDACKAKNNAALAAIPENRLRTGSSEIRNWIAVAAASDHLDVTWSDYIPCYRSLAGTGMGMGFAIWS